MKRTTSRSLALILSVALVLTSFLSFDAANYVYGAQRIKDKDDGSEHRKGKPAISYDIEKIPEENIVDQEISEENIADQNVTPIQNETIKETNALPSAQKDPAPAKPSWSTDPAIPGDQSVTLTWNPNTEEDLYAYQLEYKNSTTKWLKITDIISTTYDLEGLLNGVEYQFRIKAIDQAGNSSKYSNIVTATPLASDETAPIITLFGDEIINLSVGDTFTEPGFTATDNIDGDITANVTVNGAVDTSTAGNYVVTYNVSDASGNAAAEVIRTVIVVGAAATVDTTPPTVMPLSNGGREYSIAYGESVDLVFSEELSEASKLAVQRELFYINSKGVDTGACNHTLQFEWISPTILRVTRDAGLTGKDTESPGIFTRNAVVNITDLTGNSSEVTLVISDPAPAINKLWIYVNGSATGIASIHDNYQIKIPQGAVITKIMVEMTEPVIIEGTPVLMFDINDIDYEFGKITLPWPTNPIKLRIYPDSGSPTGEIHGTWVLNFPEGSTRDLGPYSQVNALTTYYLIAESADDESAPIITLLGDEIINLSVGDTFTEPGFIATDNIDGDITANVTVNGTVDTSTAGNYVITYNVNDASGNAAAEVTRTVIVAGASTVDTTPPTVITLSNGGREYSIAYGESVDLVFSEELSEASKLAVQRELFYINSKGVDTGACNHTLQFEWISPTILRVTRDAGLTGKDTESPGIFTRNAVVNITDLTGNSSEVTLVISDPAPAINKLWIYVNGSATGIASTHDNYQIKIPQGAVITNIMVEMTEPVIIEGTPVLMFNINDIDYRFGKITLPWPTNPVKLRIYPDSGNPTGEIHGTWVLNFPEGSTRDLGPYSQINALTTYYLIAE